MPLPHATKSEPRSVKRFVLLKIVLGVMIFLLGVKTILNLSRPDTSTADLHQIDALAVEAYQKHLTAVNLELVKGTLHEASDPTRRCQSTLMAPIYFSGSATLNLKNGTKVELNITECHPCVWPVEPGEDISAFANLVVTSDDNVSFSIYSFVGGTGESSSGTFSILLPTDLDQRICILQIISAGYTKPQMAVLPGNKPFL
mgnify:CR=1 FL=1